MEAVGDSKVAVILVHHTRKAKSEDPLDLASGTSGITGGADSVWILMRPRHQPEGILHIIGRDLEEEGEHAVEFNADAATWRLVGTRGKFNCRSSRRRSSPLLASSQ
jgi:RecA-family ATPase